nr:MAG TPA: hypothetical protein [Caudoviricetes sp.]
MRCSKTYKRKADVKFCPMHRNRIRAFFMLARQCTFQDIAASNPVRTL